MEHSSRFAGQGLNVPHMKCMTVVTIVSYSYRTIIIVAKMLVGFIHNNLGVILELKKGLRKLRFTSRAQLGMWYKFFCFLKG